jgi:hypothetical protein
MAAAARIFTVNRMNATRSAPPAYGVVIPRQGLGPVTPARRGGRHDRLWWLAGALTASGAGLIPWMIGLATWLPDSTRAWNWSTAWTGLDALEALGLLSTGALLIRRDARYRLTATVTATLLLIDAWFDVTTAAPGSARMLALAMAVFLELPTSAVCTVLAARGYPRKPGHPPATIAASRATGRSGAVPAKGPAPLY